MLLPNRQFPLALLEMRLPGVQSATHSEAMLVTTLSGSDLDVVFVLFQWSQAALEKGGCVGGDTYVRARLLNPGESVGFIGEGAGEDLGAVIVNA